MSVPNFKRSPNQIYFLQCQTTKLIKIGITNNVKNRVTDIQVSCPTKLVLIGSVPGHRSFEYSLHQRFADARVRGEWFSPVPELLEFIKARETAKIFAAELDAKLELNRLNGTTT